MYSIGIVSFRDFYTKSLKFHIFSSSITGCSLNIVFFFEDFKIYSGLLPLSVSPLGVSVCTKWQVKQQGCSRPCRVQKNHNNLRENTIFNEIPVRE